MASRNLWRQFQRLLPQSRTTVVTIDANNGDRTSTASTETGATLVVQGESVAAGNKAFVRDREIVGQAPDLPTYTESV